MKRSVLIVSPAAYASQGPPSSKKEDVCGNNSLGAGSCLAHSNNFGVMAGART